MSEESPAITLEVQPVSGHFPGWLREAFLNGKADGILVIYPSESSRRQGLELLASHGLSADTTHHLTLDRLVDLVHLDLKLPRKLQDGPGLFSVVHALSKTQAENNGFPLLFAPSKQRRVWQPRNTERLATLHRTLMQLDHPWSWDEDPGAREYDRILRKVGQLLEGTHPALVEKTACEALKAGPTPFTLNDVDGVLMLDTAPDYTESQMSFLRTIALHRPVHHLCNPGSFRLGFHGAYIDDVPYVTQETLPSWLPPHDVLTPKEAEQTATKPPNLHRVQLHQRAHAFEAAVDLLRNYKASNQGSVLVIDGLADSNEERWRSRLTDLGIHLGRGTAPLNTAPGINHLIRMLRLGTGSEAWAMAQLRGLMSHKALPIINGTVAHAAHPTKEDWVPRPHSEVLENLSRSFHVRGGPGALSRWVRTLRNARPQLGRESEQALQALEETQWWLQCVAHLWAPFIEGDDRGVLNQRLIGCSTGESLPLPAVLESGSSWFNHVLANLDWEQLAGRDGIYDPTLPALQLLIEANGKSGEMLDKAGLKTPTSGILFIEHIERLAAGVNFPSERTSSRDVQVLTPENAHGVHADLVLMVGMDVDSWSMKMPKIPWLDPPTKLKLGMLHTDLAVRKGRHHLRHLFNAAPCVVVFDSTLEEGGGPAAPLAEWLNDAQRTGEYIQFQGAPEFLPEHSIAGEDAHRAWQYDPTTPEHQWLTPRPFTMEVVDGSVMGIRSGHRSRDNRQRTGLGLRGNGEERGRLNAPHAVAMAHESSITNDRIQRQPTFTELEDNEYMPWAVRNQIATTDLFILDPTFNQAKIGSREQVTWPHLGMRKSARIRGVSIDPRPLPPPHLPKGALLDVLGVKTKGVNRKVWSASRIQPWLTCPRQAWATGHLKAEAQEEESEDLDHRIRGQIIHDAEAALLSAHQVPVGSHALSESYPLHQGINPTPASGWSSILIHLEESVPWLKRNDAIAAHRCRDLIGVGPSQWRAHLEGEFELPIGGRIGRMLVADYGLRNAAPIACEWPVATSGATSVELDATNDLGQPSPFKIRGNIDRVDELKLAPNMVEKAIQDGLLTLEGKPAITNLRQPSKQGPAKRFVIIRDLKTVNGPKVKQTGERHLKALFNEVQLGLYARAWELAHPGDRVVGVSVVEVGEFTTHYVELDPEITPYLEGVELGERTDVTSAQFRFVDDSDYESNGFRAWIAERLQTARRAVDTAEAGLVHPVPSSSCSFCKVRSICPSSVLGGEAR